MKTDKNGKALCFYCRRPIKRPTPGRSQIMTHMHCVKRALGIMLTLPKTK